MKHPNDFSGSERLACLCVMFWALFIVGMSLALVSIIWSLS